NYNDAETATDLYNGNISETFWKTNSDNKLRKYQFSYDNLNRLLDASYSRVNETTAPNAYREQLDYDKNGNIQNLNRYGVIDDANYAIHIDDLQYTYDTENKNQLVNVEDKTNSPKGFKDGVNEGNDYEYDANGNLIADKNKEIETIIYNHLNLPTEINFASADKIEYLYNATGQKVTKIVTETGIETQTDYLAGGFQYKVNELQFFPHPEGYVNVIDDKYNYVFNYTDHLGNIRVSYGVDPSTSTLKILEENHYYPFGLKHEGYNMDYKMYQKIQSGAIAIRLAAPLQPNYKYRYNSKEFQDELGLNVYDYDNRVYDQAVGRFWQIDPKAENGRRWSPYNYCFNNPVYFLDPDGMWPDPAWLKNYVKGAWSATINLAAGVATSTYNSASNGVNATKSVYNAYKNDGVKGAVKEYANQVYTTSGAKSAVATVKKASTGDAKAVATTVFNVAAVVIVHKVAKGSGATVEASEGSIASSKANTLKANRAQGANYEAQVKSGLENNGLTVAEQVTIEASNGTKTRPDFLTVNSEGAIGITEAKSSATASFTPNQLIAFPLIEEFGGVVKGNNGASIGLPAGTQIPPTKVNVVRPND
ncbi:MAG TPA: RHS repeat-associated core domain-containing protein, partial [Flavobacterium sp.]|nr:RHS repeat-associated core domain-containing protein [Flavobacterium sp.]